MKCKKLRKVLAGFLAAVMSLSVYAAPVFAETAEESVTEEEVLDGTTAVSGKSGDLDWSIDSNGKLTISGSGDYDYGSNTYYGGIPGWHDYCNSVKTAVVDVKDITRTDNMFLDCSKLTSIEFRNFDTSNVTNMGGMFRGCSSLTSLDLKKFNTSKVIDMSKMFSYCSSLTNLDLSSFDTSNVTNMAFMFEWCNKLTSLNLSSFNTEKVDDMLGMFLDCTSLTSLDLSSFNLNKFRGAADIFDFYGCNSLTSLQMPGGVKDYISLPGSGWKDENGTVCTEVIKNTVPMQYTRSVSEVTVTTEYTTGKNTGVYVPSSDKNGITAGMTTSNLNKSDTEYCWLYYEDGTWKVAQDWKTGNEWLSWKPEKYGDYVLMARARSISNPAKGEEASVAVSYHPNIKGKCQMPYTGEGGGYLIGVESYDNADYQYEMLILDCTLLAEGKDAWTYTTGKCSVPENSFWTIWQPQYGYYWTLFRVYDKNGNLIDEDCYGFENI